MACSWCVYYGHFCLMLVTSPYLRPPAGQTVQEGCPRCDHCSILNNAYCFHEDGVSQNTYAFIVFDNAAQNTCEFIDFVTVASRISTHSAYDGDAQNPYNDMPSRCKGKEDLQKASSLVCCTIPNRKNAISTAVLCVQGYAAPNASNKPVYMKNKMHICGACE